MMLNIILLDEVAEHNSLLKTLLEQEITALGEQAEYRSAVTGEEAVAFAAQTNGPSIYFLDIELGTESSGIDAAYKIHALDPDGYIVYVSAYQQYAMDCLHSHVFDFLSKPVSSIELSACLKAILKDMKKAPSVAQDKFLLSAGGQDYFVPTQDIVSIHSKRNFCEMVVEHQFYRWKEPLKKVAERLKDKNFLLVSRAALVNMKHVSSIDWNERTLKLDTGEYIAFSRSATEAIKDWQGRIQRGL